MALQAQSMSPSQTDIKIDAFSDSINTKHHIKRSNNYYSHLCQSMANMCPLNGLNKSSDNRYHDKINTSY